MDFHCPITAFVTASTLMTLKRRNKFGAKKTRSNSLFGSRLYDSKGEAERGAQLQLLEMAGEISDLQFQVQFNLTRANITYRADFTYMERGRMVAEDFKGVETDRFKLICKLWNAYGPCVLRVTQRNRRGGFCIKREIMPGKI